LRKITKHIPNAITSLNMLCGALGIVFVCRGNLTTAFWLMVVASVFDFLDGFAARMLKAYSPMGKELDSLSDVVSFGLLPSFMMYSVYRQAAPLEWMSFLPFILVLFSAVRLAKFNVDTRQTKHFLGLPTPTSALLVASMVLYTQHSSVWQSWFASWWVIPALTVLLSALLISNIPMFSLKFKNLSFKENAIPFSFLLLCAVSVPVIALTGRHVSLMLLCCCGLYIIMSGIFWISGHHRR
jgi:CDP-diacylglycerol--serine O-phosphatidyltransferase